MTEFLQLVRGADALLAARVELTAAARAGSRRALLGGSRDAAIAHISRAGTLVQRAAELVQRHDAALATSITQAQEGIAAIGVALPERALVRAAIEPQVELLGSLQANVAGRIEGAEPLADPAAAAIWNRAATLVRDGIELPESLRESSRALVDSQPLVDASARLGSALRLPVEELRARDMYEVARIIRTLGDARPAAIASLTEQTAAELERAARLVDRGIELPAGWSVRASLEHARARTLWSDADVALARVRDIVWSRTGPTSETELADLRTLRNAPEELRLPQLSVLREDMPLTPLDAETLRALRAATAADSVRAEVASELLDATTTLADILPRQNIAAELQSVRDRLARFGGLPLPDGERQLVDDTLALIDRTISRRDGYGGWRDLGDVGRVTANTELLARLEGSRVAPVVAAAAPGAKSAGAEFGVALEESADAAAAPAQDSAETLAW
jgi:hypothetical protein